MRQNTIKAREYAIPTSYVRVVIPYTGHAAPAAPAAPIISPAEDIEGELDRETTLTPTPAWETTKMELRKALLATLRVHRPQNTADALETPDSD